MSRFCVRSQRRCIDTYGRAGENMHTYLDFSRDNPEFGGWLCNRIEAECAPDGELYWGNCIYVCDSSASSTYSPDYGTSHSAKLKLCTATELAPPTVVDLMMQPVREKPIPTPAPTPTPIVKPPPIIDIFYLMVLAVKYWWIPVVLVGIILGIVLWRRRK